MQERLLYEYAVIRVVPRVEREEFLNVGIVLFCKQKRYLKAVFHLDPKKLELFRSEIDPGQLEQNLKAFVRICEGAPDGGPIAREDVPERFRWLTAVRSSAIQTSRPHPGFTHDLEKTLECLFRDLVL